MYYILGISALVLTSLMVCFFLLYKKFVQYFKEQKPDENILKMMNENLIAITKNVSNQLLDTTKSLNERLSDVTKQVNDRLKENYQAIQEANKRTNERLDGAAKVTSKMTVELAARFCKMEEANKRIYDVGKDIASLQEILKAPKLRGNLGELFLGDLLTQMLPRENFELQYKFKSGETVDAVVKLKDSFLIPIDAKFSLENFSKMIATKDEKEKERVRKVFVSDIKKRVNEISKKYILPDEKTLDFALMYIPAENVYYEIIIRDANNDSICDYALKNKVIPISPNNFFVYLQTILIGLKGFQIEKKAKEIQTYLSHLKIDFSKFNDHFSIIGKHIGNASKQYYESEKFLDRFTGKLDEINVYEREQRPIEITDEEEVKQLETQE